MSKICGENVTTRYGFAPAVPKDLLNSSQTFECKKGLLKESARGRMDRYGRYYGLLARHPRICNGCLKFENRLKRNPYIENQEYCTWLLWQRINCFPLHAL